MSYSNSYPRSAARYGDTYDQHPDASIDAYDPYLGASTRPHDPYGTRVHDQYSTHVHDPYNPSQPPHQTYDQDGYEPGGYRDDPLPAVPSRKGTYESAVAESTLNVHTKESGSYFDHDELGTPQKKKTARNLRRFRYMHQGNLWTQGSRGRCVGRFACCTLMMLAFFLISTLLSLALWIRPPNININDVGAPMNGSAIQLQSDGLQINLGVNFSVANPNYFAVAFKKVQADIFYPIENTNIGGGLIDNLVFKAHETTNFTFPFTIKYKESLDPNHKIIIDIATKCGFVGSTKTNIKVNYKITLGLRVLFVVVSPVISNSFSFECPLQQSDIAGLIGGSDLGGLAGLF